jgi:glutamate--cysteine ligase
LDVNPYLPLGIDETQMSFVDLFLLWCLVQDSPAISAEECDQLQKNSQRVAIEGRHPDAEIMYQGKPQPLRELASTLTQSICKFAQLIDDKNGTDCYKAACIAQQEKINNPEQVLSHTVLESVKKAQSYRAFSLTQSELFSEHFSRPLSLDKQQHWTDCANESLQSQRDIEAADHGDFDSFLTDYLRQ